MVINERWVDFPVSARELNLFKEVLDEFILAFPEASDAVALHSRVVEIYLENFVA